MHPLLDWTGRAMRENKRGAIPANILPFMERLQVNESEWVKGLVQCGWLYKSVLDTKHNYS